jgi:hypothetical protein
VTSQATEGEAVEIDYRAVAEEWARGVANGWGERVACLYALARAHMHDLPLEDLAAMATDAALILSRMED